MDEERSGVTFGQICGVLFGRTKLFLILAAASFVASLAGVYLLNTLSQDYEGMIFYDVPGLTNSSYIDGSKFDCRDLITLEKLEKYQDEHDELSKLNMEDIYYGGKIKSFKFETIWKPNENKLTEYDYDFLIDKQGYRIVLDGFSFNDEQASTLVEAIANEPINITKEKIDKANYNNYLQLYDSSENYDDKVNYLQNEQDFIVAKYNSLIEAYGDVYLDDGYYGGETEDYKIEKLKVSDIRLQASETFHNYPISAIRYELILAGYIDENGVTEFKEYLENSRDEYLRLQALAQNKLDLLIAQRDALLASITSTAIESLELSAYNQEIIDLTKLIEDYKEEIRLIDIKLAKINMTETDPEYGQYQIDLAAFDARLAEYRDVLEMLANKYTAIEKTIRKQNCFVYFDDNSVVARTEGKSIVVVGAIAVAVGICLPILVNLVIYMGTLAKENDYSKKNKNAEQK